REVFDRDALRADWGVTPEQVVDLQTLVGDSVDNVPGVPGIGLKTAAKLLQEYHTLENLLANVEKVAGAKRQENLRAAGQAVELTRKLVRLETDVPLEMDWETWRLRDWDAPRLLALFQQWGFARFADQVRALSPQAVGATRHQGTLFPEEESSAAQVNGPAGERPGAAPPAPAGPRWEA